MLHFDKYIPCPIICSFPPLTTPHPLNIDCDLGSSFQLKLIYCLNHHIFQILKQFYIVLAPFCIVLLSPT